MKAYILVQGIGEYDSYHTQNINIFLDKEKALDKKEKLNALYSNYKKVYNDFLKMKNIQDYHFYKEYKKQETIDYFYKNANIKINIENIEEYFTSTFEIEEIEINDEY